jgi:cyclic pyranopterin phosphate synthase
LFLLILKKIPDGIINRCEIIITDRCNFKCPYCRGLEDKLCGDLTIDSIKYILDIFNNKIKNIRFSGGEPTLNKDLLKMIKYARQNNIGHIAISTNGSNDQELYFYLMAAGVNDFSVSLDSCCSSTGDTMTGKTGQWKKVIDTIEFLSLISYITVGVVLTEQNMSELGDIIRLAHDLHVDDIRIIPAAQNGTQYPTFYIR